MAATLVEREIQHIHDLLTLRHLLADRGVATEELERYDAAIANSQEHLAAISRGAKRASSHLTRS